MGRKKNKKQSNFDLKKNPHLDALRGIFALSIVFIHVEIYNYYFDRPNPHFNFALYAFGQIAITGFFVLSGYLITLSILKNKMTSISKVVAFYKRRIFRILPLYYLLILSSIFIFPNIDLLHFQFPSSGGFSHVNDSPSYYWFYLLLMPQVALLKNIVLPFAEPTWSIGVEEIFYLVAPWIFLKIKKNLATVLVVFIILFNLVKSYQLYIDPPEGYLLLLNYYMYDCIALGCLVGVMHFNESILFRLINKKWHVLVMFLVFAVMLTKITFTPINYMPYALCFAILIAYLVNNNSTTKSPKWLIFIGKISYSLYLCHEIVIILFLNLDIDIYKQHFLIQHLLCVACSIVLASILHYGVEKPFMKYGATHSLSKYLSPLSKNNSSKT